jgi:hypothetical protein
MRKREADASDLNRLAITLLVALVVATGGYTGWLFGLLAEFWYDEFIKPFGSTRIPIGQCWGAFTGLAAGAIWCRVIIPRAARSPGKRLGCAGAIAGLGVGTLSAFLLHLLLTIVFRGTDLGVWIVGLTCGAVSGFVLGAICGAICGGSARRTT